ncbi:MAG: hypothetical protein JWO17_1438 [Actinomycetia bacterium]|nr:hypothetical protein [Actinomycetes bacterium]
MSASSHLRGIVIAGVLAAVALALGVVTLAMNQSASPAATHPIVPLKLRHPAKFAHPNAAQPSTSKKKTPAARKPNPHLVAALKAGLPRSVARALAAHPVAVVELASASDTVSRLATGEALVGTAFAKASFVLVDVDVNGGDVEALTRLLGKLPVAPATLVYMRPGTLFLTLTGFNDRTVVQQAIANAEAPSATPAAATTAAPTTTASATPAAPATTVP